jgi:hypothetical protein
LKVKTTKNSALHKEQAETAKFSGKSEQKTAKKSKQKHFQGHDAMLVLWPS